MWLSHVVVGLWVHCEFARLHSLAKSPAGSGPSSIAITASVNGNTLHIVLLHYRGCCFKLARKWIATVVVTSETKAGEIGAAHPTDTVQHGCWAMVVDSLVVA